MDTLRQQIAALGQQLEQSLERERLFREDHAQQLAAEFRGYVDDRLRHWISNRAGLALPDGAKIFTHTTDGHRILLDPTEPFITFHMLEHGEWEAPLRRVLSHLLGDGDSYIDVGANIGLHSLYATTMVGPAGRVIAIEAHPSTAALLHQNLEINGVLNRVTVVQAAATISHGETRSFEYFPQHSAMSGFSLVPSRLETSRGHPVRIDVETVRLDHLLAAHDIRSPVIKIDVEGFEPEVIEGAGIILDDPEVALILEFQPNTMDAVLGRGSGDRLFDRFRDAGFAALAITENGLVAVERAETDAPWSDILFVRPGSDRMVRVDSLIK